MPNAPTSHQRPSPGPQDIAQLAMCLSQEFKPHTEGERADVEIAVCQLAERVLDNENLLAADPVATIKATLAALDQRLQAQLNAIVHHEAFRAAESAWRGLHYLVSRSETDEMLKVRVLSVSKQDLGKALVDGTTLLNKVHDGGLGRPGGEPYGCLVGDYYFDHSEADLALLEKLARVAKAAHAPFIAGASPALAGVGSWRALVGSADLAPLDALPERAAWEAFRATEEAKYVALVMPRFLARLPYSQQHEPGSFYFEEESTLRHPMMHRAEQASAIHALVRSPSSHSLLPWCNAVYVLATHIGRSFKHFGWCATVHDGEVGAVVTGLPTPAFPSNEAQASGCPLEIALSARRGAELTEAGLVSLVHPQHTDMAIFSAAQSLHRPAQRGATTTAMRLAASLPYTLVSCRVAHYMHCIARDAPDAWRDRAQLEHHLTEWVQNYVLETLPGADDLLQAQKPLARADVVVRDPDASGRYPCQLTLRPYYRLESTAVTMKLNLMLCAL